MQVTALILAGGRGTRMGGADKGLVTYQGVRMIERVLARIIPQVDQVIINANRNLDTYQTLGYPVFTDASPHFDGPLAGMQAGLHHTETDWIVSVPCDSPLLPLDLVQLLGAAIVKEKSLMAIARSTSGNHPVFCLMHRSLLASLTSFLDCGQRKVSTWQMQHQPAYVFFEADQAFTNINSIDVSQPNTSHSTSHAS
ncbi:molybdenum cofactor guanylyltransferase MobA [Methylophilus aquaticus]|uniref:Molybdenum cofactor guanylyltransferase n=1 Tax=Methylophilus aquaticus TaxID=1971610 RepID=A0ABT9JSB7_9PROT|nr:molybdenum cofactor guanylyltransferase MobA [Methylophilus aquaticus]MDP8567467.1 molybdenum cofactor guanylyltransferase MobA [Methylophilus aquaticus]